MNDEPDRHRERLRMEKWLEITIKMHFLINAGGALATLGFMGATWAAGDAGKAAIVPLCFFVIGVICAAFGTNAEAIDAARQLSVGKLKNVPNWVMGVFLRAGKYGAIAISISFITFIAGSVSGLLMLILVSW